MRKSGRRKSGAIRGLAGVAVAVLLSAALLCGCGKARGTGHEDGTGQARGTENAADTWNAADTGEALTVTALDVGKADAIVIRTENRVIIVDTATEDEADHLLSYLDNQGINKVDVLFITHYDRDHIGGAAALIDAYPIGRIYTGPQKKKSDETKAFSKAVKKSGVSCDTVREEFEFEADGVKFEVYPPKRDNYEKKESNNSSLVIRASIGEDSILLAGDAEEERIEELLEIPVIESDIIKLPHHGEIAENTDALLEHVNPSAAIISSDHETESEETGELLSRRGIKALRTADGDVTVTLTGNGISFENGIIK